MAETNARIMDMVRKELDKNPSVSSEQLYEMARKSDSSVGDLSVRQFHARYPLQVKRARANARKARRGGAAKKTGARRGRPPGKTASARRGGRKATRTARKGATAKKARRGRPPGSGRKAAAKRAAPAKRASKRGTGRRPGRPRKTTAASAASEPGRDAVRSLLLQFARDIAGAEGKADVVEVIGEVEGWVDRLMAAAS